MASKDFWKLLGMCEQNVQHLCDYNLYELYVST